MINITINGNSVKAREDATVLEASREDPYASKQFDVNVLSLHYLKEIQEEDDSGLCIAEIKGMGMINASKVKVKEGMVITTNSAEIQKHQKEVLKKILEHHDLDCRNCFRTGNCELQEIQHILRTTKAESEKEYKVYPIRKDGIIVRDDNKCIRCGRCVAVCDKIQGVGAIKMEGEDEQKKVVPVKDTLKESGCVNCGQCISVCPVGALRERDDIDEIFDAIADPDKYVVVQVSPSVRVSAGEAFRYPIGSETKGKLVSACRKLGFDRVFDTVFGADLTIMEETKELAEHLQQEGRMPMFTSCCPGWITYCENNHPELLGHLSSCKSPQQMFGAMTKTYLAEKENRNKEDIVVVSVMPCTAKKYERTRLDEAAAGVPDVDYAITNRELARMIQKKNISFLALNDEKFDEPFGIETGSGTIFGAAGGVLESAKRTLKDMYGIDSVRAVSVSGLAQVEALLERIKNGEVLYDFVEVMACPGGCVNGGGQPQQLAEISNVIDIRSKRADSLYKLDSCCDVRKSYENSAIKELYKSYLGEPGSKKAQQYLHTTYMAKGK